MTRPRFRPLVFGLTLAGSLLAGGPALAQPDAPGPAPGEESEGRVVDGYFAAGLLAGMILFAVAKSARR